MRQVLVLFSLLLFSASAVSAGANELPLKVTLEVKNTAVELGTEPPPVLARIPAIAKVQNVSQQDLPLSVMTCSYLDDWRTDSRFIEVEKTQSCLSNYRTSLILKPGESRNIPIPLIVMQKAAPGQSTFKLIYDAQRVVYAPHTVPHDLERTDLEGGPYKSQDVTLTLNAGDHMAFWRANSDWDKKFHAQDNMTPSQDGVYKRSYFSGEPYDERTYKGGKLEGSYKVFNKNGSLRSDMNYKNGKLDGANKQFDEEGKLVNGSLHREGELLENTTYNKDGSIHAHLKYIPREKEGFGKISLPCLESDSDPTLQSELKLMKHCDPTK